MALSTQPYKGSRDFYPEDMRTRRFIFETWQKVVEQYGFEEYETPLIEPTQLYSAKTGDEIVSEQSYRFEDRGGRDVMIRPEMTPSVSRLVAARRQELPYPLRWYSIDNFWRYERPQKGRLREFWQMNVDIFGVPTIDAELELIMIASDLMKAFGADKSMYSIRVNSRKLVVLIMADFLGLDGTQMHKMTKLFDKKDKMPEGTFFSTAEEIFNAEERETGMERLHSIVSAKSMADLPETIRQSGPMKEVQILFTLLNEHGVTNARFDVSLMRGLDYYTDIVFEVFDNNPDNRRAMFGGGRYDGLVGLFGVKPLPTAGFAIGDVVFEEFLRAHNLIPDISSPTDIYVVVAGDVLRQAQGIATILRQDGVNVAVDMTARKLDKQLKAADKKGIAYTLFVGEQELNAERFPLKNMKSGEEQQLTLAEISDHLRGQK